MLSGHCFFNMGFRLRAYHYFLKTTANYSTLSTPKNILLDINITSKRDMEQIVPTPSSLPQKANKSPS